MGGPKSAWLFISHYGDLTSKLPWAWINPPAVEKIGLGKAIVSLADPYFFVPTQGVATTKRPSLKLPCGNSQCMQLAVGCAGFFNPSNASFELDELLSALWAERHRSATTSYDERMTGPANDEKEKGKNNG